MKNLLLVFAILILACGSETEVVEEPEPLVEDLPTTVDVNAVDVDGDEDPPDILKPEFMTDDWDREPIDPVPLNRDGILFEFSGDLSLFEVDLLLDGESLGWLPREALTGDAIGESITVKPPAGGPFLEHDKNYHLNLRIGDNRTWERQRLRTLRMMKKP